MDWKAAIERNREALKRVLASLRTMAKIEAGEDRPEPMPRILHRAVLRLLRPAEAATRRLIIVAARGLVVSVPPPRTPPHKGEGAASASEAPSPLWVLGGGLKGTSSRGRKGKATPASPRKPCLPLFDPPQHFGRRRRPSRAFMPRISVPGFTVPAPLPPPPGPFDELDTAALARRLVALGAALDDLPKHARRFARWRAHRDAAGAQRRSQDAARLQPTRIRRVWPLRPGRPPGRHSPRDRRPPHEVHEILTVVHGLARWALEPPDTS